MHFQFPWTEAPADARHSHFLSKLFPTKREHSPATALRRARALKFVSYYRPHVPLLLADLGCAVLVAASAVALPLCASYITGHLAELSGAENGLQHILTIGGLMLGVFAVQAVATFFVDYQGHMMGSRIEADLRRELFAHCHKLPLPFHDRNKVGQLMSRITNDTFALGELFHHGPEDLAIGLLKITGALAVLFLIDPVVAGMIAAMIPLAVIYALYFNRQIGLAWLRNKARIGAINERVEDSLAGIRVVQSFGNELLELQQFDDENQRFVESRREGYRNEAWFSVGMEGFAQIVTICVIVAGALRILTAGLSTAELLTFLLCVGVLVDPVKRLANVVRVWQEGYTGFVRAMEILELVPEITDRPGAQALRPVAGTITLQDVSFGYQGDGQRVFSGLTLEIQAGEFVALVGPSGVGKSTLCALIPRFYEVTGGQISIDGQDTREVSLASLRRSVGVVAQDVYLFSGSVAENLRYGRPDADHAAIIAAAKAANAHEFISALPQGYDTDIGQRGVKLSGGQKQRLTIARAFLKDPAILIFDEATSALDNDSESAVQQALLTLARGRTTIVIAHRLSTVRHADRIIVLTADGIGEQGTHDALMAAGGLYARLHRVSGRI
ncbi:MAG TPA: ABC transporter ATP-binding protein [Devosia sp.]|nr:ABC transporter ATP-binding protein [Devosia sp.]